MKEALKSLDARAPWLGFVAIPGFAAALAWAVFADPLADLAREPGRQFADGWKVLASLWSFGWTDTDVTGRILAGLLSLGLLTAYVRWWRTRSRRAFYRRKVAPPTDPMSTLQVAMGLEQVHRGLPPAWSKPARLAELEAQLTGQRFFERVIEEVAVDGWVLRRKVTVLTGRGRGSGVRLVVVTQPSKPSLYRDFFLTSTTMQLLTLDEASAIVFALVTRRLREVYGWAPPPSVIERLVGSINGNEVKKWEWSLVQAAMRIGASGVVDASEESKLETLGNQLFHRRAQIAVSNTGWPAQFSYRYQQAVKFPRRGENTIPLSPWLFWKRRIRRTLGMSPKIVSIPIRRANYCRRYQIDVKAPDGMYVREVGVWDYDTPQWIGRNERGPMYTDFVGTEISADLSIARANISSPWASHSDPRFHPKLKFDPRLAMRLSEIPPGRLGLPAVLAFSVLPLLWTLSVFYPKGVGINVDVVALSLAVPVLGVTVYASRVTRLVYGSIAVRIHIFVSLALSAAAIVTLFAFAKAYGPEEGKSLQAKALMDLIDRARWDKSTLMMFDPPWIALTTVAFVNALWVAVSVQVAYSRFAACRAAASFEQR